MKNVSIPDIRLDEGGNPVARMAKYPWLVVLNQDCDLLLDRLAREDGVAREGAAPVKKDKLMRSILLGPAFLLEHVLAGTYVEGASRWSSKRQDILVGNRDERFHVFYAQESILSEPIAVDFKLTTSCHPEYLYGWVASNPDNVVGRLASPYRERLLQRFTNYLGRIAEPEDFEAQAAET